MISRPFDSSAFHGRSVAKFLLGVLTLAFAFAGGAVRVPAEQVDLSTATIAELQAAMAKGTLTSEKLVQLYPARIAAYDQDGPKLNTIITLNAKALETARALDAERKATGRRRD